MFRKIASVIRAVLASVPACAVLSSEAPPSETLSSEGRSSDAQPSEAAPSVTAVPYRMDESNQAGWWKPIDERDGNVYMAYNAWGSPAAGGATDTHTVYLAQRNAAGNWSRGCLPNASGDCAVFTDDIGHNNPTITIDGDGYIHAFVAMHNTAWRYFRSSRPGDVTSMVNQSSEMPDPDGKYTYPVAARAANGDVYLAVRSYSDGFLYRWNDATDRWSRVAVFAAQPGSVVYPDDIVGDPAGNVHLIWEWAYGTAGGLRHLGSYLRYSPTTNRFQNAAGAEIAVPTTTASPVVYQPLEGEELATHRDAARDPGVQSAKIAIDPATGLPSIVYRYRTTSGGRFEVRLAQWTGRSWRRLTVYAGKHDTYAAIDVSVYDSRTRVYYAKQNESRDDQAFVAVRSPDGRWNETLLAPGVPVERLSVIRRDANDLLYLAAPSTRRLYYGALGR